MATELQWDAVYWTLTGGELSPRNPPLDVASVDDVRDGVSHMGAVGLLELPLESQVEEGVGYGTNGTEYEGTLVAPVPPASPTLTVADQGSLVAQLTISGSSVGSSNSVYIRSAAVLTWPSTPSATIAGDGSANVTLDAAGNYLAKVVSTLDGGTAPGSTDPVLFAVVDTEGDYERSEFGDTFNSTVNPELLAAFGEPLTYQRGIQAVTLVGIEGEAIHVRDDQTGIDVVVGDGSWEIDADDLDFGAGHVVPKAQDQIVTSKGEVWIVLAPGTLDAEQLFWTIPVKRSEYKELA